MNTTKSAFADLDTALNLDPDERAAAQNRHQAVTTTLRTASLIEATFLQGSFARKTMLKPLKDVDMVIVLHPAVAEEHALTAPGGATRAMNLIRRVVEQAFPGARFDVEDRPAHALQVTFADLDFTFDLVPALNDPGTEDVFIANRESDATTPWERSNTRTLNRVISERNRATGGRFVHQVRMLKQLKKDHPLLDDTCGLLWEAFAYRAVTAATDHSEALAATLAHAAQAVAGPVHDPTGVDDLTAKWTPGQRAGYAQALRTAADQAAEARRLEQDGDHDAAIDIWHTLIGDAFPASPGQTAADALRALASGSITSTGRAVTSQRAQQPARPSRSWRTR
ncbi:nucleotidyltransferase domain-containing protein [Kitasatospora mediocidica]|uniref:nucleotidyltransferase domain-containing protein n=1 Tax=Kitasatospora mediocidica TaxID=58352 RepID=UPI00055F754B|nr:nucleotidyltransferase [Kitasatospora mediocidica]